MFALMQVTTGMRAIGEVAVPLGLLTFANVLNLLLDLVWMFGWDAFGLHGIGVVGAACATVTARTVAALLGYAWLCRRSHPLRLSLLHLAGPAVARQLVALAAPQTLQILLRALLACALLLLAQRAAGDAAVTGLGITTRLDTLMLFASVGFASAATTLVGRCVARGERERSRLLGCWAGVQAALFAAVLVAVLYWYRRGVVLLFLPGASDAVVDAASRYLGIGALAHPFACFALGAIGALHGVGAMRAALLVDLAGFAGVAAGLAIGMASGAGLVGIYWGLVLGLLLLAALHAVYLQWGSWAGRAAL
jgi:Na+-driven multidrug efflux pump